MTQGIMRLGIPACGDCNMGKPCNGCATCLPRYLCADVQLTSSDLCCTQFAFKLGGGFPAYIQYDPDDPTICYMLPVQPDPLVEIADGSVCGWAGSSVCSDTRKKSGGSAATGVDLMITLHKDAEGNCYTLVESRALLPYPLVIDGTMSKEFCSFSFTATTSENDAQYQVTVSVATDMIRNRQADFKNSSCSCGTCVASQYCVILQIYGAVPCNNGFEGEAIDLYLYGILNCSTAPIDSNDSLIGETQRWVTGQPNSLLGTNPITGGNYYITIYTPDYDELAAFGSSCLLGAYVVGPEVGGIYQISLETPACGPPVKSLPPDGWDCLDMTGSMGLKRSSNRAYNNAVTRTNSTVNMTFGLSNQYGNPIGQLTITESCCGQVCIPNVPKCWTGCKEIGIFFGPASYPCLPFSVTASFIAPGDAYDGITITLQTGPGGTGVFDSVNTPPGGVENDVCMHFLSTAQYSFNAPLTCNDAFCEAQDGYPANEMPTPLTISLGLIYVNSANCDGPASPDPMNYRLVYNFEGPFAPTSSSGTSLDQYWHNTPGGIAPSSASCAPFQLDFDMPQISCACHYTGPFTILGIYPRYVGDVGGGWKVRITL